MISRDAVLKQLQKDSRFDRIWNSVAAAGQRHAAQPELSVFDYRARATTLNCLVHSELVSHFDERPGVMAREDRTNQMRFLSVDDTVLLWPKKVDFQRIKTNNMSTVHAVELVNGQANFDFMPKASVIVLGYWFDVDATLKRISFQPPSESRPLWYIDLDREAVTVIELNRRTTRDSLTLKTAAGLRITLSLLQSEM